MGPLIVPTKGETNRSPDGPLLIEEPRGYEILAIEITTIHAVAR